MAGAPVVEGVAVVGVVVSVVAGGAAAVVWVVVVEEACPQPEASMAKPSDAAAKAASTKTMDRACLTGRGYTCRGPGRLQGRPAR
jgi:hypothetical protein